MTEQNRSSKPETQYQKPSFTLLGDTGGGDVVTMTKGSDNSYSDSGGGMAKGSGSCRPELIDIPPR